MISNDKRRKGLEAQSLVEFLLISIVFLVLLFAIMEVSVASSKRAAVDFQVDHISESLPAGWDGSNPETTVHEAIAASSLLDSAKLSLTNLEVTSTRVDDVETPGAAALGAVLEGKHYVKLEISGDVKYPVGDGLTMFNGLSYSRHFDRTVRLESGRRYRDASQEKGRPRGTGAHHLRGGSARARRLRRPRGRQHRRLESRPDATRRPAIRQGDGDECPGGNQIRCGAYGG